MRKVLPIQKPSVAGYKRYAHLLAVMENNKAGVPWILNHFLQLHTEKPMEQDVHWLSFYMGEYFLFKHNNNPLVHIQEIGLELICSYTDLGKFLIDCIDRGQYVYINCDCYHLFYSDFFEKVHRRSQTLVIGYDLDNKRFIIMDYSERKQYEEIEIEMSQFVEAAMGGFIGKPRNRENIILIENEKDADYTFNLELAYGLLEDYMQGRNTYLRFPYFRKPCEKAAFGIHVYEHLYKYIDLLRNKESKVRQTVLPYHILWEHKKCLRDLGKFLADNRYADAPPELQNQLSDIVQDAFVLRNMFLKYKINHDEKLIDGMAEQLTSMKSKEAAAVEKLLELMRVHI